MKRTIVTFVIALMLAAAAAWAANSAGVARTSITKGLEFGPGGLQFTVNDDVPDDGKLAAGRLYYDETDGLTVYNGTAWATLARGGSGSLDMCYDYESLGGGKTITVDAGDLEIDLSDSTNDYAVVVDVPVSGTIDDAILVTTSHGSGVFTDGLDVSDAGLVNAISIGANSIAGTNFNVTAGTGAFVITDDTASVTCSIASTHGDAAGVVLKLDHNSGTPADDDVSAIISHYADDSGANAVEYSKIEFQTQDVTDATEDSEIEFHVMIAGTLTEELSISGESAVVVTSGLTVTAGGETITAGTLALSDGVITQTDALAATNPMLTLTNTHADGYGVEIKLLHDSATPADDDVAGRITAYADDSGGTSTLMTRIDFLADDITNASEDGQIVFYVTDAASAAKTFIIGAGTGADAGANVQIYTNVDGTTGAGLKFVHDRGANQADDDIVSRIDFYGDDSTAAETQYAKIDVICLDETDASEDGEIQFHAMKAGSITEVVNITATGLTVPVGTIVTSDGGLFITDSLTTDLVRFDNTGGAIATGEALLELDAGGAIASGGAMLLFTPGGTPAAGSIALKIAGSAKNIIGIDADVDTANNHGYLFNIGGATASAKAGFYITHDGDPASGNEAVFHVEYSGTGTNDPVTAKFESSDAVNDVLILVTNTGSTGAILKMQQENADADDDDVAARLDFYADDDGDTATNIAKMDVILEDETDASEDGTIEFHVMDAGTLEKVLIIGGGRDGSDAGHQVEIISDDTGATGVGLRLTQDQGNSAADEMW